MPLISHSLGCFTLSELPGTKVLRKHFIIVLHLFKSQDIMYHHRVFLFVVLYLSTRTNEAFELELTSSTSIIAPHLKESLNLKCKLKDPENLTLITGRARSVRSITVSRGNDVIATISAYDDPQIHKDHQTLSVEGELRYRDGYLDLHWSTADTMQAGNYTCSITFVTGEHAVNKAITITARRPSVEELYDMIMQLNERVDTSEKDLSSCEEVDSQTSLNDVLDMMSKLTKRMDDSQKEIERLTNADKKASAKSVDELSEMVSKINYRVNISENQIQKLRAGETWMDKKISELNSNLRKQAMRIETGYHYCGNSNEYQWMKSGRRRSTSRLNFRSGFDSPPTVFISVIHADTTSAWGQTRYYIQVDEVTTKGFILLCETWESSAIYNMGIYWIALKN
ncbi:uncharacterized protein LOC131940121 [Physella acuta]|uniref:uncharacterized protein LOC131940121 n=1 Tax=Physella acuta TaxID=109671 RepID=UPI0027DB1170|nr:uncharacterized protein LOC131940121 [Physella acuta]